MAVLLPSEAEAVRDAEPAAEEKLAYVIVAVLLSKKT